MKKLRTIAVIGLATAAIGVGGLVTAPEASAMPMTCSQAIRLAQHYRTMGDIYLYVINSPARASAYYGRAQGVLEAAC